MSRKRNWKVVLLDILDPGRHDRGKVWFEHPGVIRFNWEEALKKQRQKERKNDVRQ